MKIKGQQKVEIEISENERRWIAKDYLYEVFDWSEGFFIEEGEVRVRKTYHSSHSFDSNEKVREASDSDILAYKLFKKLS